MSNRISETVETPNTEESRNTQRTFRRLEPLDIEEDLIAWIMDDCMQICCLCREPCRKKILSENGSYRFENLNGHSNNGPCPKLERMPTPLEKKIMKALAKRVKTRMKKSE